MNGQTLPQKIAITMAITKAGNLPIELNKAIRGRGLRYVDSDRQDL